MRRGAWSLVLAVTLVALINCRTEPARPRVEPRLKTQPAGPPATRPALMAPTTQPVASPTTRSASQPAPPATQPAGDPMLSIDTLLPEPESDFAAKRIGSARHPTPHYAKFLRGVKVCLDPGHGGDAHQRAFKRGPTGVREAEMNLRVAQYLRELLTASGAEVKLTRAGDYDLSLRERAGVANAWGADLFISIHHNAVGNPKTNYTSIWYHGDVDFHPANLDLARYLGEGLYDHLPLEQLTDVPLKSDQLMYPGGFGVLAAARVTSALTEISFFTNPAEEQRLRDPEYNFREAYALFIGLARYAQAGLPRARLLAPADGVVRFLAPDAPADADDQPALGDDALAEPGADDGALAATDEAPPATDAHAAPAPAALLVVQLDDGLRGRRAWGSERQMILTGSLAVRINDEPMEFVFTPGDYRLFISVPADLPPGEHALEVQFTNKNKNSVLNPHFTFTVAP